MAFEQLLNEIIFWIKIHIPSCTADLVTVLHHASKLQPGLGQLFMSRKRRSLPDSDCYANLMQHLNQATPQASEHRSDPRVGWVFYFLQDLQELFELPLPKVQDEDDTPRNVLVARFMDFLVPYLIGKPYLFAFEPNLVINELRAFVTIFLDSPIQATKDDGQVNTLLSQFEALANRAGRLVHSFLFSGCRRPSKKIDELLLEPIDLLKANVIQFLNSPSYMNTPNTRHFAMSSVFIVDSFLYDIENLMNREDDPIVEVKDHVEGLYRSLKHSWSSLKNLSDQINEVKYVVLMAFDAEYLINYFLCGDAPAWYLAIRLPCIAHNVELAGTGLREMVGEHHDLDDQVLKVGDDFCARPSLQTGINSGVDDFVVGFEDEQLKILEELVGKEERLQIISIIGMPGLGKTTLAKKMYNHRMVRDKFDRISWCIVSQGYERKRLLVDILTGLDSHVQEEDDVGGRIHKTLKGRRYFIVVDDIWELRAWEDIKRYFPDDRNGSRILFTSRNKEVADQCNSTVHELPLLSHDQCWELLKKKVFHSESCPPELQHIGEKIAAQCNGLPLVVVVVAGILSTMKKDLSTWEYVRRTLKSCILSSQERDVGKSLELSYIYLPRHLKPCFLYFRRFQEDERIRVKTMIQLWIAEGFIWRDKKKRAEDIAEEYLKELIDKNLVIVAEKNYDGRAKVCTMHDLLRDMCLRIAEDDNFMRAADCEIYIFPPKVVHRLIRHSAYGRLPPCLSYIRSFVEGHNTRSTWDLNFAVRHMKVLRVLDAKYYWISDEDDWKRIKNLVHLRYLAVPNAMRKPIGRFSSLEYLILGGPIDIDSSFLDGMMKLRYLSAGDVYMKLDCNTSRTYNLEYISRVFISSQADEQQLKVFPCIRKLVWRYSGAYGDLEWCNCDLTSFTQLESFALHTPIIRQSIEIKLLPNIIKITLKDFSLSWEQMSTIGALPNLEVLKLVNVWGLGETWKTREDEFQRLKYLKLVFVNDLIEWNVSSWEHFPLLQQLIIQNCSKLKEIPSKIGDIPTMQLISVKGWEGKKSLRKSVIQIQEQLKEVGIEDVRIVVDIQDLEAIERMERAEMEIERLIEELERKTRDGDRKTEDRRTGDRTEVEETTAGV